MRFHDFPGGLDELSNDEKMYVDILLGDEIYINIDKKYDDLVELIRGFNRFLRCVFFANQAIFSTHPSFSPASIPPHHHQSNVLTTAAGFLGAFSTFSMG